MEHLAMRNQLEGDIYPLKLAPFINSSLISHRTKRLSHIHITQQNMILEDNHWILHAPTQSIQKRVKYLLHPKEFINKIHYRILVKYSKEAG